jgi:hypothetical protein
MFTGAPNTFRHRLPSNAPQVRVMETSGVFETVSKCAIDANVRHPQRTG